MTSKLVLGMALGASAAVGTAAVVGNGLSAPEVAGALALAGVIGVVNFRQNKPTALAHTLVPVAETQVEAVIAAPRARTIVAHPAMPLGGVAAAPAAAHSDAA